MILSQLCIILISFCYAGHITMKTRSVYVERQEVIKEYKKNVIN